MIIGLGPATIELHASCKGEGGGEREEGEHDQRTEGAYRSKKEFIFVTEERKMIVPLTFPS